MTRRLSSWLLAAAAAVCIPPAHAIGRLVDVDVIDRDSGVPLTVYTQRGTRYIAGHPGVRYAIRVANRTGGRVLAVMAVDGVNIVTGQTASWGQSGYVLEPWQSAEITGWRKSDAEVAAFEFTALPDSYAARTGRPLDVGVIGVAVFAERPAAPPPRPFPYESRREGALSGLTGKAAPAAAPPGSADAAGSARAEAPAEAERRAQNESSSRLGTGHGERETSYSSRTQFVRSSREPLELVSLRYDSRENLERAGVIPRRDPRPWPRPFPQSGYVPDPPGW
ncbi:MAG: hypothetical protein KF788_10330 [Piscinibacter sp.]|nr:hypothetical protein [Piscinibacter sp.]